MEIQLLNGDSHTSNQDDKMCCSTTCFKISLVSASIISIGMFIVGVSGVFNITSANNLMATAGSIILGSVVAIVWLRSLCNQSSNGSISDSDSTLYYYDIFS